MSQLVKKQKRENAVQKPQEPQNKRQRVPAIDILESEHEYTIKVDMPGLKEENIDVQYHHGELTIDGRVETSHSEESKERQWRFRQFESVDYHHAFRIGESVDTNRIVAKYRDGVLTVHLPKSEAVKPKKIEVTSRS